MIHITRSQERFSHDRYAALSGAYIEEIGEDYARCSMKITADHRNAYGAVMGGAIYTLADYAFAAASNHGKEFVTVSVVGQISFMSRSKGSVLYADARLIKDGRRNCFYEVSVTDDLGRLIAVVNINGAQTEIRFDSHTDVRG